MHNLLTTARRRVHAAAVTGRHGGTPANPQMDAAATCTHGGREGTWAGRKGRRGRFAVTLGDESENRFHMECMRRLVFTGGRVGHFVILPVVVHPSAKAFQSFCPQVCVGGCEMWLNVSVI